MNTRGDNVDEEFEGQPEEVLLSPEPEVVAPEIELLEDVTQLYLTEIGAKPLFTPEEEFAWACRARSGEFIARQKMIEHNLRLVAHIIKKYYTHFQVICKGDVPDGFFNSDARFRAIFHLRRHILSKLQM